MIDLIVHRIEKLTMTTTSGYEVMRSGNTVLFYVNRDGLPLSDRCNERMWNFCIEQYPQCETDRERDIVYSIVKCDI